MINVEVRKKGTNNSLRNMKGNSKLCLKIGEEYVLKELTLNGSRNTMMIIDLNLKCVLLIVEMLNCSVKR